MVLVLVFGVWCLVLVFVLILILIVNWGVSWSWPLMPHASTRQVQCGLVVGWKGALRFVAHFARILKRNTTTTTTQDPAELRLLLLLPTAPLLRSYYPAAGRVCSRHTPDPGQ